MSSLIRKIARKIVKDEFPRQRGFPGSDNSFPTWITSVDEHRTPPRRLIELTLDAVRAALTDIDLSDIGRRDNIPDYFPIWPGEHYRLLGAFVKVMQPRVVIEIGTDTGMSALVFKKYLPPGGKVVTYDLRPWKEVEDHVVTDADFDAQLEQRLVDLADPAKFEANRPLLEQAEFFFVDGPKNIRFEEAFMAHLAKVNFVRPPVLMFDDTRLESMIKFWRDLPYPKLDITGFAHWSGSGLVELTR